MAKRTWDAVCPHCKTPTVEEASVGTAWRRIVEAFPNISTKHADPTDASWSIDHDAEHSYRCTTCGWHGNQLTVIAREQS